MLKKPHSGGTPTRLTPARVKHHRVAGMRLPMPRRSRTSVRPVLRMMPPAQRKRRFFMMEWKYTCSSAP